MVTEANPNVHSESHSPTGDKSLNNNINSTGSSSNVYFVGLEFVRQYYTVMNQGPLYLHRFYSEDSSFVHGMSARDSKVVYGQHEIHKRIQSLNFRNCHAKIRQVDSHETVGDGVVIQVTGELSNNGQPMRRFMQTFVLAPQSPKRYYVRNDIFHYQDEVFCDDDADTGSAEAAVDNEDAEEQEAEEEVAVVSAAPAALDNAINNLGLRPNVPPTANLPTGGSSPGLSNDSAETSAVKPESLGKPTGAPEPVVSAVPQVSAAVPSAVVEETVSVVSVTRAVEEETVVVNTGGPKTYANLFKNNTSSVTSTTTVAQTSVKSNGPSTGAGNVLVNVADGGATTPPQTSPQPNSFAGAKPVDKGLPPRNPRAAGGFNRDRQDRDGRNDRNDRDGRQNERERREPRERLPSRSSTSHNAETGSVDGDKSRPVNTYPDANQLFVGNLPQTVTLQEIKEVFCEFGEVADIKIQKPTPKSANQKVPWFAFVVFEDSASAQAALKKPNIRMKIGEGGDRRLNVEEKRSRPNTGGTGGGGYSGFNRDGSTGAGHAGVNNQGSNVGGGSGHGRGYINYGDRGSAPTHSRTFRGSRGGNQNAGGDRGGRHNNSGVNTGGFQGGRASPNRNYNNNNKR